MAPSDFSNRRALVTGAGSGIGKAIAHMLAARQSRVAVLDRETAVVDRTITELPAGPHTGLTADVGCESSMKEAFSKLGQVWPELDILVINAGINGVWCPLAEMETAEWDATMNVNLRGCFLTLKLALPLLKVRGGSVVIIASINGTRLFNNVGATAYASSKAAQVAFAKMAALELASDGIRVNVVCPGAVQTNIGSSTTMRNLDKFGLPAKQGYVPLIKGAEGRPEQVAELVCFLASEASGLITGTEVYIDGAQSLLGT